MNDIKAKRCIYVATVYIMYTVERVIKARGKEVLIGEANSACSACLVKSAYVYDKQLGIAGRGRVSC